GDPPSGQGPSHLGVHGVAMAPGRPAAAGHQQDQATGILLRDGDHGADPFASGRDEDRKLPHGAVPSEVSSPSQDRASLDSPWFTPSRMSPSMSFPTGRKCSYPKFGADGWVRTSNRVRAPSSSSRARRRDSDGCGASPRD